MTKPKNRQLFKPVDAVQLKRNPNYDINLTIFEIEAEFKKLKRLLGIKVSRPWEGKVIL